VDYHQYAALAHQAAQCVEQEQYAEALIQFQALANSDISDLDKAMAYHNMAYVLENLGQEQEAIASYDKGISYEKRHSRFFVTEQKAAYLSRLGRTQECLRLYQELVTKPFLKEEEKYRFQHNIQVLQNQ
jgi:tetratricopeptide (TPR) repeat protein